MKKVLSLILTLAICLCGLSLIGTVYAVDEGNDYFYIGSYPQSKVDDTTITNELDKLVPDWDSWASYGYYSGDDSDNSMVQGDWMRYADVTYGGEKYRGVKFTQYRPSSTIYTSSDSNSWQGDNGYSINSVYWFKFEPLKWRILDADKGLVLCETIIDAQAYSNTSYVVYCDEYSYSVYNNIEHTNYANNYETSSIREWLNNDFYNTAFTSTEKKAIAITKDLDNSNVNTLMGIEGSESFDSNKTDDAIFLLSYKDITNSDYGFETRFGDSDTARTAQGTDYAKCQGLGISQSYGIKGNANWFIRTSGSYSYCACAVSTDGSTYIDYNVSQAYSGVRPAMTVDLSYTPADTETETETETNSDLPVWLDILLSLLKLVFKILVDKGIF